MADTHGMTCPCTLCASIRDRLANGSEEAQVMITKAMFWKIIAPQVNEHMQHAMSEAVRITANVKGMEPVIAKQFTALWKEVNNG